MAAKDRSPEYENRHHTRPRDTPGLGARVRNAAGWAGVFAVGGNVGAALTGDLSIGPYPGTVSVDLATWGAASTLLALVGAAYGYATTGERNQGTAKSPAVADAPRTGRNGHTDRRSGPRRGRESHGHGENPTTARAGAGDKDR